MTEEERIAIWKANEELQEEMIATRDVRIAALEAQVAERVMLATDELDYLRDLVADDPYRGNEELGEITERVLAKLHAMKGIPVKEDATWLMAWSDRAEKQIEELESQVAEMQPIVDAVSELERQVLSGIEKDIFIGITDDIPPFVHLNFDWAGTLAECLIAEAWKDDLETMKAALKGVTGE